MLSLLFMMQSTMLDHHVCTEAQKGKTKNIGHSVFFLFLVATVGFSACLLGEDEVGGI